MLTETLVTGVDRRILSLLPSGWSTTLRASRSPRRGSFDADLLLTTPAGETATLRIAAKRWTTAPTSAVTGVLTGLLATTTDPVLLVTDYANAPLRQACEKLGVSYLDSTGWLYLAVQKPAIFIRAEGDQRGPRAREANDITRLNGKAAGRLIRTLITASPPIGVRELAQQAGTSPGSAAKLLPTLAREGAVDRDEAGRVTALRRRVLMDRWTADYSFLNSNGLVLDFLAPRGLPRVLEKLNGDNDFCVTGSAAARTFLPERTTSVVPLTTLMLYAQDLRGIAERLGLVRTDRATSNVLIAAPRDPQLTQDPDRTKDGLPRAPLGVVLADLLSMPGRSAQEAEQLMDYLATADPSWR